jgi:hypothetical protein
MSAPHRQEPKEEREQPREGQPREQARAGPFTATGDYVWFALSDGSDAHEYPVIDIRRKVLTPLERRNC